MLDYLRFKEINALFASGHYEEAKHLLLEAQARCLALRDEMRMLRIRLQSLEEALALARNLYCEHGFYWLKTNGVRQGPFCPRCYDQEAILVHLDKMGDALACAYCGEVFRKPASSPPPDATPPARHAKILKFAR